MQIMRHIKLKLSGFLGNKNGSAFVPDENDVMLVGYPKSGNTWLDFLVACLLSPKVEDVNFISIEKIVADIYFNDSFTLARMPAPRVLKSHEHYNHQYGKVVYIVRDPRDVAVSYYYHHLKLKTFNETYPLDYFVKKFISGGWDDFSTWGKHVDGWLNRQGDDDFLLLRYEDLKEKLEIVLGDIVRFINVPCDEHKVRHAIQWCSAENMRNMEYKNHSQHDSFKESRKDIPFVREAKAPRSDILSPESKSLIELAWEAPMSRLGYIQDGNT